MGGARGRKRKDGKTQNGKKANQRDVPGLSKAEKRKLLEEKREKKKAETAVKKTKAKFTVDELLDKVEECMDSFNYDVAQKFCQRALELEPDNLRALEVSGLLLLEVGDGEKAKQCFGRAVELSPDEGFTKYMCLGQLLSGEEAVACYNKGIQVMVAQRQKQQAQVEGAAACDPDSQTVSSQEISSAYCSIAEIYLTDSCFEDSAEDKCLESLSRAIEECPTNPEAHLLMASYRLSKDNRDGAKQAIEKSLSLWLPDRRDAEEEEEEMEENVPEEPPLPYEQRVATSKILIELEMMSAAERVLAGLLVEDDEVVQVWYLLGWLHYLQGEDHKSVARDNLQHALKIYPLVGCDDEDMLAHIKELLEELGPGQEEEGDGEEEMEEEQEEFTLEDEDEEDSTENAMDH